MTKVQSILLELEHLNSKELEIILSELMKKINRKKRAEAILDDYIGKGKGVWGNDAQKYIDDLREDK
jgi:hypothetical protein